MPNRAVSQIWDSRNRFHHARATTRHLAFVASLYDSDILVNEVVAGARRLKAARIAALESLLVRVVKLTDAEAIEAQVVELSVVRKSFLC